ncbi:TetR/AcrR family transcriptional regulator [Dietzia sp. 179-F 9C3 NHS]|uniref:TetR/AcrR family transcriptional regulator n=1 Tax=Dietzia sp. 179-F 9C3 NHS TaxID=3374295 RepID=UPI0038799BA7
MGRPRRHDLDGLLGHARALWVARGPAGVTIRGLGASSGASNGALYHAFGSRDGLLARVWALEAKAYLSLLEDRIDRARADTGAIEALVAAALTPAAFAESDPDGARLLLSTRTDELLTPRLDDEGRALLRGFHARLSGHLADLADGLWGRRDDVAVTTVRHCVVTLPGALLLRAEHLTDPVSLHVLDRAVRGAVSEPPPGPGRQAG